LNNLVVQPPQLGLPWWKQALKDDKNSHDASRDNQASKGSKGSRKSVKKRSVQTKVDQKLKCASITSSYVQRMSGASKKAAELEAALKEAQRRSIELAEEQKVNVKELDLPVHWFKQQEMSEGAGAASCVVKVTQLTPHQCHRSWFQHSFIIFMYLHPCICAENVDYTCTATVVKNNTLLGWLVKPELVVCWLPMVSEIKASDILGSLPPDFRENFVDVVDGNSGVCVKSLRKR
jgi:hypothetical protein